MVGGAEINCKRVSERLASLGHDVHVVTTNVGGVQGYYQFGVPRVGPASEVISGVSVTRLPYSGRAYDFAGWTNGQDWPARLGQRVAGRIASALRQRLAGMVAQQIAAIRPDVVMTMPHLVVNVGAVLAAKRRVEFPLVMVPMLHEHDPNWDVEGMARALKAADAVIAMTAHEAERLVAAYGVTRESVFLAAVGVDTQPELPSQTERAERVIFLGRKVASKGIADLIDAMRIVWRERPRAELCLAEVRTPETEAIDRRIAALPERWRARVKDFGTLPDESKGEFLQSARCLALPSKTESFGMVILEAWAHGTPVVAWDLPVFRSIVDEGVNGLLVDPSGGKEALAQAIVRLLQAPGVAAHMGKAGYNTARRSYRWSHVAEQYLEAYRFAVSRRAR